MTLTTETDDCQIHCPAQLIIGSEMSKDGAYEFLMARAPMTEGTCNMVQYKVAYDSSNQDMPHQALKILIYKLCFDYPNWGGSIRFPATLQKANKLAQFVSTQGEETIEKSGPRWIIIFDIKKSVKEVAQKKEKQRFKINFFINFPL
jgi:hypothetical protein